jgi:hypothetical protein
MRTERSVIPTPVSGSGAWTPAPSQPPRRGPVYWLSGALAIITVIAATITLAAPHLLTGPAAMNGSARGTALVVLVVAVPSLMLSLGSTRDGSLVTTAILMGTLGYLTYNSMMFVFGTSYNRVFLLYVAMLSLSLWSLLVFAWRVVPAVRATTVRLGRPVAVYLWLVAAMNALISGSPRSFPRSLRTGPARSPTEWVWRPTRYSSRTWRSGCRPPGWSRSDCGVATRGVGCWPGRPGLLVHRTLGVAVDQWFGSTADPASTVTAMTMVPAFAGLAVIGLAPMWIVLRSLRGTHLDWTAPLHERTKVPAALRRMDLSKGSRKITMNSDH